MIAILFKDSTFKAPLLSFTVECSLIYSAALKMFKIYDSTPAGSNDDVDRWTFYLKALAVKLIGSSLVKKTNCRKMPLDYITGIN